MNTPHTPNWTRIEASNRRHWENVYAEGVRDSSDDKPQPDTTEITVDYDDLPYAVINALRNKGLVILTGDTLVIRSVRGAR